MTKVADGKTRPERPPIRPDLRRHHGRSAARSRSPCSGALFPRRPSSFGSTGSRRARSRRNFCGAAAATCDRRRFRGRFGVEDEPKVYLERELGLETAGRYYGRDAKVWRWEMRWFRSGVKEEERVAITPLGDLASFESVRKDDAPGPRPSREEARAVSLRFLESRGLAASLEPIEATPVSRPARTDWTFVDERKGFKMGEATVRYATTVSTNEVAAFQGVRARPGDVDAGVREAPLEEQHGQPRRELRALPHVPRDDRRADHEARPQRRSLEARGRLRGSSRSCSLSSRPSTGFP